MEKNMRVVGFGKFVVRNKPVRKVGIDTNLILPWIKNEKYCSKYQPNFCRFPDKLFINHEVFGELMGLLLRQKYLDLDSFGVKNLLFEFLRKNNLTLLKKKFLNIEKFDETLSKLKNKFQDIEEKDLRIISIFYCSDIDCIFSANERHFAEPCKFLGINYERHFEIEQGSEQDVDRMLRNLSRPKKHH